MEKPVFRRQHTGNAVLDRIQGVVEDLVAFARDQHSRQPVSLSLRTPFTTSSDLSQDTKLAFPVRAGETWDLEFWGNSQCSSTDGVKYEVGAPPDSTVSGWLESSSTNTSVTNWTTTEINAVNTQFGPFHAGASNAARPDRLQARVKAGRDGVVAIRICSETAATTTILSAKAHLRATRVTEVGP